MHQFVYYSIIMIENSTWFVGDYIFSNMLGPIMDNFLNHYRWGPFTIPSPFEGQGTSDDFAFDFR